MNIIQAIENSGISPPSNIVADGNIHRFRSDKKSQSKDGWYLLHENTDFQAGGFGCWKNNINEKFISIDKNSLTPTQQAEYAQQIQNAQEKQKSEIANKQTKAKQTANKRFNKAKTNGVDEHPYLIKKQIQGLNLMRENDLLLVPMFHNHELVNIQTIDTQGRKMFSVGGRVKGAYHLIGTPTKRIILCEGYSTGASINQATGEAVGVCFNAGNLKDGAKHLKSLYPDTDFIIAGDNDQFNEVNTGKDKAIETAQVLNCGYVLPKFKDEDLNDKPTDFNDCHILYGLGEVKKQIQNLQNEQEPIQDKVLLRDDEGKKKSQSTLLIEITKRHCNLFHNDEGDTFASIQVNSHFENYPIKSTGFKDWLGSQYFNLTNKGVGNKAITEAIDTIGAIAKYDGKTQEVYLRVAQTQDKIYLDLCNDDWQVIEVGKTGWQILDKSPVAFIRNKGMLSLVEPQQSQNINLLKNHLNIKDEDFSLIAGWLLMSLQGGNGAYPILILQGEQGTAKSTTAKMLRKLIDPHKAGVRIQPKKQDDLVNMAINNYLTVLDNLSGINHNISDTLCCFSTGAGQTKRKLYTDNEDSTINIKRPIMLNGIDDIATRGDLASRSILINLPSITARKDEKSIWQDFNNDLPTVFGALLSGLSAGLNNIQNTDIESLPRMADFTKWAMATTKAYGWVDEFMTAYQNNIKDFSINSVENSIFATAIVKLSQGHIDWSGTASGLLDKLNNDYVDERTIQSNEWVTTPKAVSNQLRRWKPQLKQIGIHVEHSRSNGQNIITIKKTGHNKRGTF